MHGSHKTIKWTDHQRWSTWQTSSKPNKICIINDSEWLRFMAINDKLTSKVNRNNKIMTREKEKKANLLEMVNSLLRYGTTNYARHSLSRYWVVGARNAERCIVTKDAMHFVGWLFFERNARSIGCKSHYIGPTSSATDNKYFALWKWHR